MNGKNICLMINQYNWHDYYLDSISLDYDNVKIVLCDYSDAKTVLVCEQYIGIQYLGHWDECVVDNIHVQNRNELTEKSLEIVKNNYPQNMCGGGSRKLDDEWLECIIRLIDNNEVKIVCKNVFIENAS